MNYLHKKAVSGKIILYKRTIREPQDHYSEAHIVWEISRTVLLPL